MSRVRGPPCRGDFVRRESLAGVFYAVDSEGEGGEVFDGMEDVGEVVEGRDFDAVLHAYHAGVGVWHPRWPSWLQ